MAKHYTIARPYAKALFEQALTGQMLDEWAVMLDGLALLVRDVRVLHMWRDPTIDEQTLCAFLLQVAADCLPAEVGKIGDRLENTITLLLKEKRLEVLPDIRDLYLRKLAEHKNLIEVEIWSALTLNEMQQKAFYAALEARFQSTVSIRFKEDKSLIGGALMRSGNWVLDGSIRGKLSRLSESLMKE